MKKSMGMLIPLLFLVISAALPAQEREGESRAEEAVRKAEEAARAAAEAAREAARTAGERIQEGARELLLGEDRLEPPLIRVRRLAGLEAIDEQGEPAGVVEDVVLARDGQVSALILEVSDHEELPDGRYLVPAGQVEMRGQDLRLAGGLSAGQRLLPSDPAALSTLLEDGAVLAANLLEYPVHGSDGEEIGRIDDVVLDLQERRVVYAALGTGGFLGLEQKRIAVPFEDVRYDLVQERASVEVSAERLRELEGFPRDRWPRQAEENWQETGREAGDAP